MTATTRAAGLAAAIGVIVVLPLVILQSLNVAIRPEQITDLLALFGLVWFLSAAFVLLLLSLVRPMQTEGALPANHGHRVMSVILLVLIAVAWSGLMADQMPCFLGVPNCD